ncbi:hypothetical protein DB42_DB00160 [Neochlamydia sp. EPS4]|nr:hypothetical protein DB42_DB00160 [Neochlamydia sp. EPS4]KIC76958.1 hypothetical protein DB41_DP00100 [Neochlamydia sp. TUME1]
MNELKNLVILCAQSLFETQGPWINNFFANSMGNKGSCFKEYICSPFKSSAHRENYNLFYSKL